MSTRSSLGSNDCIQFFTFPHGTLVTTKATLQEFKCSLFTGNLQKFHTSSFIGGKSTDFSNKFSYHLISYSNSSFSSSMSWFELCFLLSFHGKSSKIPYI